MNVHIESTRMVCDHCDETKEGIILASFFAEHIQNTIQLCDEHAVFFAREILRIAGHHETKDCSVCGGSGFSGYGTGYDAVCDNCAGSGEEIV